MFNDMKYSLDFILYFFFIVVLCYEYMFSYTKQESTDKSRCEVILNISE